MNGISCSRINGSDLLFTHTKMKIKPEEENEMTTTRKCKRRERRARFQGTRLNLFHFAYALFVVEKIMMFNDKIWQKLETFYHCAFHRMNQIEKDRDRHRDRDWMSVAGMLDNFETCVHHQFPSRYYLKI